MYSNKIKKSVYQMAKDGNQNIEIARELQLAPKTVKDMIENLKNPHKKDYNLALYEEIYFKRNVFKEIIDKDFLTDIIDLIEEGFLIIEIATIFNSDEKKILNTIESLNKPTNPFYNPDLYSNIMEKIIKNNTQNSETFIQRLTELLKKGYDLKKIANSTIIKKYLKKIEQTKLAKNIIQEYLDSEMHIPDQALANKYHCSIHTVQSYLRGTDSESIILKLYGEEVLQKILESRKERQIVAKKTYKKSYIINTFSTPTNLTDYEKKQLKSIHSKLQFWYKVIFTFKLSIEEFAKLVNFSNLQVLHDELYNHSDYYSDFYPNALIFLHSNYGGFNEENYKRAKKFLTLLSISKKCAPEEYQKMLKQIIDYDYYYLVNKIKKDEDYSYSMEDVSIIIEYRLKYALPFSALPVDRSILENYCPEHLREEAEKLNSFNLERSRIDFSRRKTKINS